MHSQTKIGFLLAWIVLAFLVFATFGLLSHFEIFHFKNLLPSSCSFGQEIDCENFNLERDGISLNLINHLKSPLIVTNISIARKGVPIDCQADIKEFSWMAGTPLSTFVACKFIESEMVFGFKEKLQVYISYYPPQSGPIFEKKVSGSVFGTYQNISTGD